MSTTPSSVLHGAFKAPGPFEFPHVNGNEYYLDCSFPSKSGSARGIGSDEEGPFRFDCNALEVKLSPRSRELEAGNSASDAMFEALVAEVTGLPLQYFFAGRETLWYR